MAQNHLFTSESVSEGHPDKVCDQVSDAVLDAALAGDPHSRVACETLTTTNLCVVAGEITTKSNIDYEKVARDTIRKIGYCRDEYGFNSDTCEVQVRVHEQSPDISMGVTATEDKDQGAGDQGLMFGFACRETPQLMPAPIIYSHLLVRKLAEQRHNGDLKWCRPDSKSQVTARYIDNELKEITTVVISTQHDPEVSQEEIHESVVEGLIKKVIPSELLASDCRFLVNPTGRFEIGGPHGDCGLTGRKIIVDTYGGMGRHGGGAFSGKDPSKVDRSAAYAARWAAKNVVAGDLADRCEVQLAYAIGVAEPVSIHVDTQGSNKGIPDEKIAEALGKVFDFRPRAIIESLDLLRPIYGPTAAYGHFGREEDGFTWEQTNKAEELASVAKDLAGAQV